MAILQYNEITIKKIIEFDGDPYEVLESHVFRMQKRKPVNQTKLRNLMSGKVIERSFHQQEKAEEAEIETRKAKYLYARKSEFWFCEENNPSKRFSLEEKVIGPGGKFLKGNTVIDVLSFGEKTIGIRMPIKAELKVTEASPAVKGNTAQGALKQVTLETGATINVPLFIKEGDVLRINTETGEYSERV
ncbi:MAG: elongation factor P [Patescibacteria group bacterium]